MRVRLSGRRPTSPGSAGDNAEPSPALTAAPFPNCSGRCDRMPAPRGWLNASPAPRRRQAARPPDRARLPEAHPPIACGSHPCGRSGTASASARPPNLSKSPPSACSRSWKDRHLIPLSVTAFFAATWSSSPFTPTTANGRSASRSTSSRSCGTSARHGPHHDAQKLSSTTADQRSVSGQRTGASIKRGSWGFTPRFWSNHLGSLSMTMLGFDSRNASNALRSPSTSLSNA
jgi:hypothetical protein